MFVSGFLVSNAMFASKWISEMRNNNKAYGMIISGNMFALALIVGVTSLKSFDVLVFTVLNAMGMVIILVFTVVLDFLFYKIKLHGAIEEKNETVAKIYFATYLVIGILFSSSILWY